MHNVISYKVVSNYARTCSGAMHSLVMKCDLRLNAKLTCM